MRKKYSKKKRRSPRTPALDKGKLTSSDLQSLDKAMAPVTEILHLFIYDAESHKFFNLLLGLQAIGCISPCENEKYLALALEKLLMNAWRFARADEARRFKVLNNVSLLQAIKEAQRGDDYWFFRLVAFDKKRLGDNFVIGRISRAQAERDTQFFEKLGMAVKEISGLLGGERGKLDVRRDNMKILMRCLRISGFDFARPDVNKICTDLIYEARNRLGEDLLPEPDDSGTVKRSLRRMGMPVD